MTSCIASGSRRSASREESTMSQKSTVTCLRSPSRAAFEVRIFSARCLGVYASGDANLGAAGWAARGLPQLPQNFLPAGTVAPQEAQARSSLAPHSSQKLTLARFSKRHCGQALARTPHLRPLHRDG